MAVYLNGYTAKWAENCGFRTACQLGQRTDLPYFNAFSSIFLTLPALYQQIDTQIQTVLAQTGWSPETLATTPILLGSTGYVIADCEARLAANQPLPNSYSLAVVGEYLQQRYGAPVYQFATSCTASAQAIYYGYQLLQAAQFSQVLIIGFESFNRLTFEHFHAMHLLAEKLNTSGIILGEGVGTLALSRTTSSCELLGVASLTDSDSLTNSCEEKLTQLIEKILQQSGCQPCDITQVKPHLIGGEFDQAESALLQKIFKNRPLVCPKSTIGHTLGASGVLETAWALQYLKENSNAPQHLLSYFLGFGGSNVGWVMRVNTGE